MNRYIKREDAVFAACKVLDKFGGCKMWDECKEELIKWLKQEATP